MTDKTFDPVTDGTPEELWDACVTAMVAEDDAHLRLIQARDNAMRRKGMLEAAEIADARAVEWGSYSALPRIAVNDTAGHIRTAAEKIREKEENGKTTD